MQVNMLDAKSQLSCQPMWMPLSVRLWINRLHGCVAADAPAARHQSLAAGALLLPVLDGHVIQTAQLPLVHHDSFGHLLITQAQAQAQAQAQVESLMALSSDAHWPAYDVPLRRPRHSSTVLGTKL
ncbi:hypothetical protein [Cyanobium sp. BA20m-14]|uniref:hypothetical protein n=1 Tax=Cyanobium sp. BA20m-14 TaxID=2823703 RepID=UPI0020CE60AD|nr:hypothetical protein [Cyanobium sp. BA20m-14]